MDLPAADLRTGGDIARGPTLDKAMRTLWDIIEKLAFQLEDHEAWERLLRNAFHFDTHLIRLIDERVGNAL